MRVVPTELENLGSEKLETSPTYKIMPYGSK